MPLEILRLRFTPLPAERKITVSGHEITVPSAALDQQSDKVDSVTGWIPTTSAVLERLQLLASASKQIADKLYLRSGVYLLIGVLVAFSGLAFFYYQQGSATEVAVDRALAVTTKALDAALAASRAGDASKQSVIPKETTDWKESLLHTLPRFGILFFIETIAFFFLRQYRTAMDEYRYFEAIKRRREENFVLLSLLASKDPLDLTKLPQQVSLYSDVAALAPGQTTDLLESRKLNKEETAILEKVVDAITKIKA